MTGFLLGLCLGDVPIYYHSNPIITGTTSLTYTEQSYDLINYCITYKVKLPKLNTMIVSDMVIFTNSLLKGYTTHNHVAYL